MDFKQCANNDSPTPLGTCHWINSILQQSNSRYVEGMSTLQRLIFTNIATTSGNVHTLTFRHQATKGSAAAHAYDFLTSWDQAVAAANAIAPGQNLLGTIIPCGQEIGPPASLASTCNSLLSGGNLVTPSLPDVMGDPTIGGNVNARITAYETVFSDRTLEIFGNAAITAASVAFNGYTTGSDQDAKYTLTWTSASSDIMVRFAGHIAVGVDPLGAGIGYGSGKGAASISGGPYHIPLDLLDGASLGNQDNQLKGADVLLPPTVLTAIHDSSHNVITSAPIGATVHDSATVTGDAGAATGSVSFTVFLGNTTCTGTGTAAGTVTLVAGVAHPSNTATVPAGGLSYMAHYAPDASAKYVPGDSDCEPLTANKLASNTATEIHNAAHNAITSAPIGSTVHDQATVTGALTTPTGTVDFTVWANTSCDGTGTAAGTAVPLVAGVAHPSDTAVVGTTGLSFKAHYNGDDTYLASTSDCEPLTANKLASNTATEIHNAAHNAITSAPIGSTVHDQATVTGALTTPTGTVDFTVWANTSCDGTGTAAGTAVPLVAGVAHPSDTAVVGTTGLSFKAHYNGDDTYLASTSDCEPLTANKLASNTATEIHNAAHNAITSAPIGSTVHDQATVTGALTTPTGTVDFTVWANTSCDGTGTAAGTAVPLVAGVAHPSDTAVVGTTGLSFKAHYNGDDTYLASTSDCEPLTANKLASNTATEIHNAAHNAITSAPIGSTVHDQATVTGALTTPTGTVDFTVWANTSCDGTGTAAGTAVPLVAGVAHPSDTAVVGTTGLSFKAHYNGDDTYLASTSDCEPLTANKLASNTATEIHNAAHNAITSAPIGSTVHDQATVTGALTTPTGTVDFTVWANTSCDGTGTAAGTAVPLVAGVAHPSDTAVVGTTGLSFKAHYNGDDTYLASTSDCEPLTANKLASNTATEIHNAAHNAITSAPIGSTVHDQATVTGALTTPTGTVDFTVWANTSCDGTGTAAGTAVPLVAGVAHPSDTAVVGTTGLSFKAHYNGDDTYLASTSDCEPLTANKLASNTATEIHNAAHNAITSAPIGSTVHDQATVTGALTTPTGTVDFTVWANTSCDGTGTAAGTAVPLVAGVAHPSDTAVVGTTGLSFKAHYNGDDTYLASTSDCEPLTANKLASNTATEIHNAAHNAITSAPIGSTVHDQATVTGALTTPTGTVDFTVWANTSCDGTGTAAGTAVPLVAGVAHPSDTAVVGTTGLSFKAHYNGDDTYLASTSDCEPLTANKLASNTATEIHNAAHNAITSAPIGSTVHDQATVTGALTTPTGTVDFTVWANTSCDGTGTAAGTAVPLVAGVAHPSDTAVVGTTGLSFKAHYNGDDTYLASTSDCEPLTANKLASNTATEIHNAAHNAITSAPIGSTVHDQATVTGALTTPTGTVDFTVWANTSCDGTGTAAGTAVPLVAGVAHPSDTAVVGTTGLSFKAHYNGDDTYLASTSDCEPLTANKLAVEHGHRDPQRVVRRGDHPERGYLGPDRHDRPRQGHRHRDRGRRDPHRHRDLHGVVR